MFQREIIEILNKFFIEISFKSKLKGIGEFGCSFGLVGKPSLSRI
jgi:hypothetical protein